MAQTFISGKLTLVEPVTTKETYSSQRIEITVQEFDPNSGEAKTPSVFPLMIFNKKIAELAALSKLNSQVIAKCYIKSIPSEKEGKTYYNIGLNAVELKTV
jgi:hypothetical protein